ncbi:MAG: hypothetical protein ACOYYJ_09050, partial [Chloroflexota bacterium]
NPFHILATLVKPVFGAISGLLLGTLALTYESSALVSILAGLALMWIVFSSGCVNILSGMVIGLIFPFFYHQEIRKLAHTLTISEIVGGGNAGSVSETLFVWFAGVVAGVLIAGILRFLISRFMKLQGHEDIFEEDGAMKVFKGATILFGGVLLGLGTQEILATEVDISSLEIIILWGAAGALLGLSINFIPGPPWD